jgi:hypothetical protein
MAKEWWEFRKKIIFPSGWLSIDVKANTKVHPVRGIG